MPLATPMVRRCTAALGSAPSRVHRLPLVPVAYSVLVIEDDDDARDLLGAVLEVNGFEVVKAAGVDQAMQRLDEMHIQLCVADLGLPEPELGVGLIRYIRARCPRAMIMVVSGESAYWLNIARTAGADMMLGKPVEPQLLAELVLAAASGSPNR